MTDRELSKLWKNQPIAVEPVDPGTLRGRANAFRRLIRARNLREYMAAAAVFVIFAVYLVVFDNPLIRLGSALAMAATVFVALELRRRASWIEPSAEQLGAACLAFHRAALVRQRDALKNAWAWYVLPFMPGAALFLTGVAMDHRDKGAAVIAIGAGMAAFGAVIAWLNRVAAARLQREIDGLDELAA